MSPVGNVYAAARGALADALTHAEVARFLALEAECLDDRRFADWLELVDDDFVYQMPTPVTPDNPVTPHYDETGLVIDETRETLTEHWFRRYEPDMWEIAWSENPPVRYRHFIANVRVRETAQADRYEARSNVLATATRQSDQPTFLSLERFDLLRRGEDGWRLARRLVVSDITVMDFAQLRVVL